MTSTGYVPNAVLGPIRQVQATAPAESAVFVVRPCAVLGPLLYVTTIEHVELAIVRAFAVASVFRPTGEVTDNVTVFAAGGAGVGEAVGALVIGRGVAIAGADVRGTAVVGAIAAALTPTEGVAVEAAVGVRVVVLVAAAVVVDVTAAVRVEFGVALAGRALDTVLAGATVADEPRTYAATSDPPTMNARFRKV
ncbi:MAG TPA: hypothetical protein VEP48_08800 [Methylomirabilota bacterium]|nr:hypothetical protein [Methylomirabilota bacterium]